MTPQRFAALALFLASCVAVPLTAQSPAGPDCAINECCPEGVVGPTTGGPKGPTTGGPRGPTTGGRGGSGGGPITQSGGTTDGQTTASPTGCITHTVLFPPVDTGLSGFASCYSGTAKLNLTPLFGGGGGGCCGGCGPIVVPDPPEEPGSETTPLPLQPRPGGLPGCILYRDNGIYYQYGSPIQLGPSATFTPISPNPNPVSGGTASGSNHSGAQLWYFPAAGEKPEYVEVKHTDGSVAHFEAFTYETTGTDVKIWLVTWVRDPWDNQADYAYDEHLRLERIDYPSGLQQHWNWAPSWKTNWTSQNSHSFLEISYTRGTTALTDLTWAMVFEQQNSSPRRMHFDAKIYRIYAPVRRILHEVDDGETYDTSNFVSARTVREFVYNAATHTTLSEVQKVHVGTDFAETLSTVSDLPDREALYSTFDSNGRVTTQVFTQTTVPTTYTYGLTVTRTSDVPSGVTLAAMKTTDGEGNEQVWEYDVATGRIYRTITIPAVRPRAAHVSTENSGIGGVASAAIEPDKIIVDRIFDTSCVCQKPIEVRVQSVLGSTTTTRVTKYEYWSDSKQIKKITMPNPATGSGQPAEVDYSFTYVQAKTSSQYWGAWLRATEVTQDGTWEYMYSNWRDRTDATYHGQMPGTVERKMASVRRQTSLTGSPTTGQAVSMTVHHNLPNTPGSMSFQGPLQGMPRKAIDGDGVVSTLEYDSSGYLTAVNAGATRTSYLRNSWGNVTETTENAGSTSLAAVVSVTSQSPTGLAYGVSVTSGGVSHETKYWHDRWGNLAVVQRNNLNSAGQKPSKYGGSNSSARDWVESQYHYQHWLLVDMYEDRKPLDEAASGSGSDAWMRRTQYEYADNGWLLKVIHPSGSETVYELDGYGTLYRTLVRKSPSDTSPVRGPKIFINAFLEPVGSYESTGATGGADHLWTLVTRTAAGTVSQVVEPSTSHTGMGSTGGAVHEFDVDSSGRVVEARVRASVGGPPLAKRELRWDELMRQIWKKDSVLGFGSGDHTVAWLWKDGKESLLDSVLKTGSLSLTYAYDSHGRQSSVTDNGGNVASWAYHASTDFLALATRVDVDGSSTKTYETRYDVDNLGRVTAVKEGPTSAQLVHGYGYNTLGVVDTYTDPIGKVQRFLPDGLGRLVEHVRVADSTHQIRNWTKFFDWVGSDGTTKVERYDGLDHVTVTHFDHAGRLFLVQNPGADLTNPPTSSSPNRSMCLYAKFDGASRVSSVFDGDGGQTDFWRDGPGRVIQRALVAHVANIATYNTKDILARDAMGRLVTMGLLGATSTSGTITHGSVVATEYFDQDSLGRIHEERYQINGVTNLLKVSSGFSGGDPFRTSLQYLDNLGSGVTGALHLEFDKDTIGRLSQVRWNTAPGVGSMTTLADYTWVGGLRRARTVTYSSGNTGKESFDYDAYGRLTQIKDDRTLSGSGTTTISQFDYEYDAASNLKKERYTTVGGRVGDRFLNDGYHRLGDAFLGVDATTMALSDADLLVLAYSASSVQKKITYGLDVANNREDVTEYTSGNTGGATASYTLQGGSHQQGPSNRYNTVAAVTQVYDGRGNLTFDGQFHYRYDYLNRLQEVWRVAEETETEAFSYGLLDESVLQESVQSVRMAVGDYARRAMREHRDPSFRARMRARIRGGVVRIRPLGSGPRRGGGGGWPGPFVADAELVLHAVYGYDAFNRRIVRLVMDDAAYFHVYDGWREVGQYVLNTSTYAAEPIKEFVHGSRLDEIVAYRRRVGSSGSYTWESYFLHHGGQDTAAKLVDVNGAVVEQYEYDPYGRVRVFNGSGTEIGNGASVVGLPFLWKSIRLDNETGLLYMRNRYYSALAGRFLTVDPLGGWADDANLGNGYAYSANDPLDRRDSLGLFTSYWHRTITNNVMVGRIGKKCIKMIAEANVAQDDGWWYGGGAFGDPLNHGDNNRLGETIERMRKRWSSVCSAQCESCEQVFSALREFGRFLHALQDLYSHSEYVERNGGTFPGLSGGSAKPGDIPLWPLWGEGGPNADEGGSSGHYQWPFDDYSGPGSYSPATFQGNLSNRKLSPASHAMTNKDSAGSPRSRLRNNGGDGSSNFSLAVDLATRHTEAAWTDLVLRMPIGTESLLRRCCKDD